MSEQEADHGTPARSDRRPLWIVAVGLLLAAALLWGASSLTWQVTVRELPVRGRVPQVDDGATLAPALQPLALLALAGIAGVVASTGWLRRVLGAVLALAGVAAGWLALNGIGAVFGDRPDDYPRLEIAAGRGLAVLAGLLLVGVGLLVLARGARMARLGGAYQAPGARRGEQDPNRAMWQAFSEGEDPTARD
ncbi:Trp biosynthesis-associated membrane protein [Tamaricihabitans halophyticus]|uniref:Trp biosynthesis-associated membrane protein n=1 Tax=Tamaricihabitans halophyticus TaxID=1262583 RepID=UPI001FB2335D|nr:Trp biosynthesis-associated membrane protein [Tamaricihabitans halophyticus]